MSQVNRFRRLVVSSIACLLLAAGPAAAAQITIAWDANPEADIAGYIVEYGPAGSPFSLSADVGNVTAWTLASATAGVDYSFRVVAYNNGGERSDASGPVTATAADTTPGGPTLTPDRTALVFGVVADPQQPRTPAQTIRLTQAGSGSVSWTATSNATWLSISPSSGSGSGTMTVSLVMAALPASSASASITIVATGSSNTIAPIPVTLNVLTSSAHESPFGSFDTPADNTTGVTGSLAITGWALDDVDVTRVRILRDPVAGEAPGSLIFIGDATLVDDARPDVAAMFSTLPRSYRAGWGYLALTNMLPNRGNGTFRFSAYADDADGNSTLLGTRTVTCSNASATLPFGAIDTPAPGETVGGSMYLSFGWVLTRGPKRADVAGGGTVSVLIDGVNVGSPAGWVSRPDLLSFFPAADYPGVPWSLAVFGFDTTTLANGVHTMAWVVTDSGGATEGIGSRYFRVFNASSAVTAASMTASASRTSGVSLTDEVARAQVDASPVEARRGFAADAAFRAHQPAATGVVTVQSEELGRIELKTQGATAGYLRSGADLRPLPIGSRLDPITGIFLWQPGVGFVGSYDLVFVRRSGGGLVRQDVRIVLNPKGANRLGPQVMVDLVGPVLGGWAADLDSPDDRGIERLHVWAYPAAGGDPVFVGEATYGGERPDVAAVYGDRFLKTGYGLHVQGLNPGAYDLAIFAWSSAKGTWLPAKVVRLDVK